MSRNKKVEITPRKLQEIRQDVVGQTMILTLAYLMDDEDFDSERLLGVWDGVTRYAEAVDSHLISLRKVCDIINKSTGLGIRWNR